MESTNYSLGDIAAMLGNHSGFSNGDGFVAWTPSGSQAASSTVTTG